MIQKILIIGTVWPEPNSSAAGSRMIQLIKCFIQQGYQVHFASTASDSEFMFDLTKLNVEKHAITLNSDSFNVFVKDLNPHLVLFDRFMIEEQFGWRVAESCPHALRILDTEDLHCLRAARQNCFKNKTVFSLKDLLKEPVSKRELASIFRCDISLIISSYEMDVLKDLFKVPTELLCYLPFLLPKITSKTAFKSFENKQHFISIGNFLHEPNKNAVLYLKEEIWPLIKKQLPTAELHIYGAYVPQQILEMNNKKTGFLVKGRAEDANTVMTNARVLLAPLRFGAGIKGKLVEAMQNGTPSVTTNIGAEGMHNNLPWNGFVTDNLNDFVNKAVNLYQDKVVWNKSVDNGVEIINSIYDVDILSEYFINKINKVLDNLEIHRLNNFYGSLLMQQTTSATKYMSKWIEAKNKL